MHGRKGLKKERPREEKCNSLQWFKPCNSFSPSSFKLWFKMGSGSKNWIRGRYWVHGWVETETKPFCSRWMKAVKWSKFLHWSAQVRVNDFLGVLFSIKNLISCFLLWDGKVTGMTKLLLGTGMLCSPLPLSLFLCLTLTQAHTYFQSNIQTCNHHPLLQTF